MGCKKATVLYDGGKRIVIPLPERVDISLREPGKRPIAFGIDVDREGLRNLGKVFKRLGKGGR